MTVTYMEVYDCNGENFPLFQLERTRDGLASYCATRWPVGRRKSVAKEWDLSADEARSVCEGSASQATIDKIWRHRPRGGWAVLLPVMGAVIGQPIHEFFRAQNERATREAAHALEHERLARTAYRSLADDAAPPGEDRRTWPSAGEVGAAKARRVAGGER